MDATAKTVIVIAFVVVALLLLLLGNGMQTGTMMSGGMMGSGSSWMWPATALIVVLGAVLLSVIFGEK